MMPQLASHIRSTACARFSVGPHVAGEGVIACSTFMGGSRVDRGETYATAVMARMCRSVKRRPAILTSGREIFRGRTEFSAPQVRPCDRSAVRVDDGSNLEASGA